MDLEDDNFPDREQEAWKMMAHPDAQPPIPVEGSWGC